MNVPVTLRSLGALGAAAVVIALAQTAGASADGSSAASPAPSASPVLVVIRNYAFVPAAITVKAGTAVQWRNDDSVSHTATEANGTFDSHNLDKGMVYTFTFAKPGTYSYVCSYHPNMTGTVTVTAP